MCMICGDPGNIQTEAQIATHVVAGLPIIGWFVWRGKIIWRSMIENSKCIASNVWKRKKSKPN